MKIQDKNAQPAPIGPAVPRGENARANADRAAGGTPPVPQERIDLSGRARDVQKLQKAAADAPEIREDRVAELKARIDNGTYGVSSEDIASKMVGDSLLDLIR